MKKLILILLLVPMASCSGGDNEINNCADSELGVNCQDADYIENSDSPYVLPWKTGKTFVMGQVNCTDGSHILGGQSQFAYDINMQIGTKIVAMRSGIVVEVIESFEDIEAGTAGIYDETNIIRIRHPDGTRASYAHLTLNGALKNEGDSVVQGEIIALSGNTGNTTGPHLHVQVTECEDISISCNSLPLTFKNTSEHCLGLLDFDNNPYGYKAEPY
tara:strand:+ start:66 stop:716 length:651 start_codon:yes stop_codon:yes gene_type:complete